MASLGHAELSEEHVPFIFDNWGFITMNDE